MTTGILIGGAGNGGQVTQLQTDQIQQVYNNLITNGSNAFSITGSHILVMTAGEIGQAGQIQSQANLESTETVQQDQQTLNAIGAYCRSHGIGIQIDAALSIDNGAATVNQWIPAAALADLPIVAVNDCQEVGLSAQQSTTPATFDYARYAANEVASVQAIVDAYRQFDPSYNISKMSVGDMEPGASTAWWNTYDAAAAAAGVPGISYVIQDMDWDVPWSYGGQWEAALKTMAAATNNAGIALDLDFQGMRTAASGVQYVQQVEQYAAMLAASGVSVSNISLESWQVNPTTMTPINDPDSVANAAVEITAILPLYQSGAINFQGMARVTTPSQEIVAPGSLVSLTDVVLYANPSTTLMTTAGVVLVDLYGTLSATQFGFGTVTQTSFNVLTLTGDQADLAAELGSIKIEETNSGPDTVDIQTFGATGQMADTSIAILAVATAQGTVTILPTTSAQDWTQASAIINAAGTIASETVKWANTPTPASGGIGIVHTVAIHDPLAEYGVTLVNGVVEDVYDPLTDYDQGSSAFANYPTQSGQGRAFAAAFDAAGNTININVLSSTKFFDPKSGSLETVTCKLAPTSISYVDAHSGTSTPDTFATAFVNGGRQVTEMNTGNNPNWQAGWGDQFASATLTYDSQGILIEEFLQGGTGNPSFTLDDVFDPNTGAIWEQFQSNPQPSNYSNGITGTSFVTGSVDITQFWAPGNPNWQYSDWGADSTVDTEVWLDYYMTSNAAIPDLAVNSGCIDVINVPGTISLDLNAPGGDVLDSVIVPGPSGAIVGIDAWGATGTVSITGLAAGRSTLVGGDYITTVVGFGNDTIVAGKGLTTVDTGSGGSSVRVTSATGSTSLFGNRNTVTAVAGGRLILNGTSNTVNSSGATMSVAATDTCLALTGNDNMVTAVAGDALILNGNADTVNGSGIEMSLVMADTGLSVIGNGDTVVAGAGTAITIAGTNDTVTLAGSGVTVDISTANAIWVNGTAAEIVANLSELATLAAAGSIKGIGLTDSGTPVFSLTATAQAADMAAINLISGAFNLSILGLDVDFNAAYYLNQNPDVAASGMNPAQHYAMYGWEEGRDPNANFSTSAYLQANPDVGAAHIDPLLHYVEFGRAEGRMSFIAQPHGVGPQDPLVDNTYYFSQYSDVSAVGVNPFTHYDTFGWREGRNPDALFNTRYYLQQNPDVAAAGVDPLLHYEDFGWKEGRNPSANFSTSAYLNAYPDVKAAGLDPLMHYEAYGIHEGRAIFHV